MFRRMFKIMVISALTLMLYHALAANPAWSRLVFKEIPAQAERWWTALKDRWAGASATPDSSQSPSSPSPAQTLETHIQMLLSRRADLVEKRADLVRQIEREGKNSSPAAAARNPKLINLARAVLKTEEELNELLRRLKQALEGLPAAAAAEIAEKHGLSLRPLPSEGAEIADRLPAILREALQTDSPAAPGFDPRWRLPAEQQAELLRQAEQRAAQADAERAKIQKAWMDAGQTCEKQRQELAALKTALTELTPMKAELAEARRKLTAAESARDAAETARAATVAECKKLAEQARTVQTKSNNLAAETRQWRDRAAELEQQKAAVEQMGTTNLVDLGRKNSLLETEIAEKTRALADARQKIAAMEKHAGTQPPSVCASCAPPKITDLEKQSRPAPPVITPPAPPAAAPGFSAPPKKPALQLKTWSVRLRQGQPYFAQGVYFRLLDDDASHGVKVRIGGNASLKLALGVRHQINERLSVQCTEKDGFKDSAVFVFEALE